MLPHIRANGSREENWHFRSWRQNHLNTHPQLPPSECNLMYWDATFSSCEIEVYSPHTKNKPLLHILGEDVHTNWAKTITYIDFLDGKSNNHWGYRMKWNEKKNHLNILDAGNTKKGHINTLCGHTLFRFIGDVSITKRCRRGCPVIF